MARRKPEAVCHKCGTSFHYKPGMTGVSRLSCPQCSATVLIPLSSGVRVLHWVLLPIWGGATLLSLIRIGSAAGNEAANVVVFLVFLALFVSMVVGLVKDSKVRAEMRKRERS
jgi:uncharacterized paraquat-inducible protein A